MTAVPSAVCLTVPTTQPPKVFAEAEKAALRDRIKAKLKAENAVLVTHYYTDPDLQQLTEETGGIVSDSLEMARFGNKHDATTLIVCGVRFMGETAKILTPNKRVLMPTLEAECSLDLGCPIEPFTQFCDEHPDRTVVVYANTSAAVKARADWVVTSSIAVDVVEYLTDRGEKLIWAPDRNLGRYIQEKTDADMLLWNATCVVHDEFKAKALQQAKVIHPDAAVLVHPESPEAVIALADAVGSTSQLIHAAKTLPHKKLIVATDGGIFYKMQRAAPDKEFIVAPTAGAGGTCRSCAHCPWMRMNALDNLAASFDEPGHEIFVDEKIIPKALRSLQRMVDFANERGVSAAGRR